MAVLHVVLWRENHSIGQYTIFWIIAMLPRSQETFQDEPNMIYKVACYWLTVEQKSRLGENAVLQLLVQKDAELNSRMHLKGVVICSCKIRNTVFKSTDIGTV